MSLKYNFTQDGSSGALSEESTKKYFSRLGWGIFTLGAASTVAFAILSIIVTLFFPHLLENNVTSILLNHIVTIISIYAIAVPLFCIVVKKLPKLKPLKSKMKVGSFFGGLCIALLLMTAGSYISNFVLSLVQIFFGTAAENPLDQIISPEDPWIVLLTVVFGVIIIPILEEILFRKLLCDRLLALGEGYAIIVSAVIFGLIHGNFYQFAYAFLLGALFALIYVKTGKIRYSAIYHMFLNFFGMVLTPWIMSHVDLDVITKILEAETLELTAEMYSSLATSFLFLLLYDAITFIPMIAGIVLLILAIQKKKIKLDTGILTPPKKGRFANIFCTVGVAAAVTYFVISFALSILP